MYHVVFSPTTAANFCTESCGSNLVKVRGLAGRRKRRIVEWHLVGGHVHKPLTARLAREWAADQMTPPDGAYCMPRSDTWGDAGTLATTSLGRRF